MDDAKSFPLDGKEAPAKEACVSCRRSKVKCAPSSEEGKKCERCARLGLECQGAGPSKRGRPGIFGSERFKASRERAAAAGEPEHLQVGAADAVQRPAGAGAPIVATLQRFAGSLPMGSVPDHSYSQSGNASLLASPSAAGTPGRGTPGVATPVISLGATPEQGSVGKLLAAAAARTDAVLVFPSTPSASASPNLDTRFLSTGPVSGHSEPRDGQSSAGNVSPAAAALPLTDWLTGCGVMRSELGCTAADVPDFGFSLPVRMLEGKPLKAARGQRSSQESGSQLLQSASAGMMPRGASAWPVFVSPPGMYVEPEDGFEPMLDFIVKTMPSRLAQRALVQTWASVAREENSYAKLSGALKTAEAVGLPAAGVLADTAPLGLLGGPQAAAHPGSLPPFVAEWFQGSCPCMVRYALGGKVQWHVNAAAEDAWALRLDPVLAGLPRVFGSIYPEGDWLPRTEMWGTFLRRPEVQLCLAQLMAQVFGQMLSLALPSTDTPAHFSADVPLPLPVEFRGQVVGTYQVRSRLVNCGMHSWAASAFLPPSSFHLPPPAPLPFIDYGYGYAQRPPARRDADARALQPPLGSGAAEALNDELLYALTAADGCVLEELLAIAAESGSTLGPECAEKWGLSLPPRLAWGAGGSAFGAAEWLAEDEFGLDAGGSELVDGLFNSMAAEIIEAGLDCELTDAGLLQDCSPRPHSPMQPRLFTAAH